MADFTQNAVSAAIWRWRNPDDSKNRSRSHSTGKPVLQGLLLVGIACVIYWRWHSVIMSLVPLTLGLLILVSGFFLPRVYSRVDEVGRRVAQLVGIILSWLLLVPFYVLCFVPGRIILVIRKRDPLNRRFLSAKTSYWIERSSPKDIRQYRKQYL